MQVDRHITDVFKLYLRSATTRNDTYRTECATVDNIIYVRFNEPFSDVYAARNTSFRIHHARISTGVVWGSKGCVRRQTGVNGVGRGGDELYGKMNK